MSAGDEDRQLQSAARPAARPDDGDINGALKPLRRACDCCRKRKVRCDGDDPCGPCRKTSIRCAYLQQPRKKGPKGLRSARVIHALRHINDSIDRASSATWSPAQPAGLDDWPRPGESTPTALPVVTPESSTQQTPPRLHADASSAGSDRGTTRSPTEYSTPLGRLPASSFLPFMQLFYNHMFPIMPVIDCGVYLNPSFYSDSALWNSDLYCFLCAICAATVVQLDDSIPQPAPLSSSQTNDACFVDECLRERQTFDFVASPSTLSVMTSFFLFSFFGNHEQHVKAWFYLQECITISENLNMDLEESYAKLDPIEAQWRRRLYWLLFITERAYSVQRRKQTRLHAAIQLPAVFESEDPLLFNGFVNLANLFSVVGDDFVRAWRGSRRSSLCNETWLTETQKQLDAAALALDNVTETQHLDISVTREWLHVLAWQMGVSNGLIWGRGDGGMRLDYPVELARKVVEITTTADALALDSHGIGMEQKLSDIAGCLADVLKCTAGDTSTTFVEGKQYLGILLQQLSSRRGKQSRYLKPLMSKTEGFMGYELNQTLPLPTDPMLSYPQEAAGHMYGRRISVADSVGMLRSLSMSGNLGMPSLTLPNQQLDERRGSGRVYDEMETDWLMNGSARVA